MSSSATEKLLSITADELNIAFVRDDVVTVATRSNLESEFSAPISVTIPDGYSIAHGAALSADGLRLVVISSDKTKFAELTRTAQSSEFSDVASEAAFSAINGTLHQTKRLISSPVISASDTHFYYAEYIEGGASFVMESRRQEQKPWSVGQGLAELASDKGASRRLPTGISSDERTLFYFNEQSGKEEARFRDGLSSPFYQLVELADRRDAQPNSECTRLYSSKSGDVVHEGQ